MRLRTERCDDCTLLKRRCANHIACDAQRDARTAADIGIGWALFVRGQVDARRPWPDYAGRCAAIARRLVGWLADNDARRDELARICSWRAGIRWELIATTSRDRPYQRPDGAGVVYTLPGYDGLQIRFRPRSAQLGPRSASPLRDARYGARAASGHL